MKKDGVLEVNYTRSVVRHLDGPGLEVQMGFEGLLRNLSFELNLVNVVVK